MHDPPVIAIVKRPTTNTTLINFMQKHSPQCV